jgi:hypothetical protein
MEKDEHTGSDGVDGVESSSDNWEQELRKLLKEVE